MVLCPKGHHQVKQTGSVRAYIGEATIIVNGTSVKFPPSEKVTLHFECLVCGTRFSVNLKSDTRQRSRRR